MSKANQLVIDKLKEMRVSGEPVWVTFKGLRLKIRPDKPDGDFFEPAQAALFKHRGRLHVGYLSGKYTGYLYCWGPLEGGPRPPDCSLHLQYNCILAIVEEFHPRVAQEEKP